MKRSPWVGIGVATLIAALAMWFGLISLQSNRVVGLAVLAVGIVFSMYGLAAFSGVDESASVAFNSAVWVLTGTTALVVLFTINGMASFAVAAPVFGLGLGGAIGLPPVGNSLRTLTRVVAAIVATVIAVLIYWVDHTVYALVAPLMPLPAVGLADGLFARGRGIIAASND